jgi:putative nucleotidyltransferase with HDIG domain
MFHRTQLLLDQANALEKAGQWQSAVTLCETLFENSWRSGHVEDLLEGLLRLGILYSSRHDRAVAAEYLELALTISRNWSDHIRAARSLNGLGVLNQRSGDIDAAAACFLEARELSAATNDNRVKADINVNLGIIANIRGDLEAALNHYVTALREYESIGGYSQRVAQALNNIGMLYTDLLEYPKAVAALERAAAICRDIGDVHIEGIVMANWTELSLALGDLEGARSTCDAAYEIASRVGDDTLKADVLKSYGIIFRNTSKPHLAESHFLQAIQVASHVGAPLIEAEANRELALVFREQDRNREALLALNRAHSLFTVLQARQKQADIDKRFKQLEEDFLLLVARWGDSIEAKDLYTRGHCQRVAEYACKLAIKAGLVDRDIVWFRMGAFLHDVGKTEVPEEILNKPGRLTDEERLTMERHTVAGDEMLAAIEFPWDVRPMVRSHHERWDGRGYPDRLQNLDIPFSARVLHIADVFDALTTTRSYRQPLTPLAAFQLMESDVGSFDPELFELFRQILPDITEAMGLEVTLTTA